MVPAGGFPAAVQVTAFDGTPSSTRGGPRCACAGEARRASSRDGDIVVGYVGVDLNKRAGFPGLLQSLLRTRTVDAFLTIESRTDLARHSKRDVVQGSERLKGPICRSFLVDGTWRCANQPLLEGVPLRIG